MSYPKGVGAPSLSVLLIVSRRLFSLTTVRDGICERMYLAFSRQANRYAFVTVSSPAGFRPACGRTSRSGGFIHSFPPKRDGTFSAGSGCI